jgi:hypothetical protein
MVVGTRPAILAIPARAHYAAGGRKSMPYASSFNHEIEFICFFLF